MHNTKCRRMVVYIIINTEVCLLVPYCGGQLSVVKLELDNQCGLRLLPS